MGYLLIAVVVSGREPAEALGSMAFYLLDYAFMNLGAFAALLWLERAYGEGLSWRDLAGIGRRSPAVALALAIFLLSLAGIPPTAGFVAKFWVFPAGWKAGHGGLVLVGFFFFSWLIRQYNGVIAMDEGVKGQWAQVENQLKRRYDLIPNLVETVKGPRTRRRSSRTSPPPGRSTSRRGRSERRSRPRRGWSGRSPGCSCSSGLVCVRRNVG